MYLNIDTCMHNGRPPVGGGGIKFGRVLQMVQRQGRGDAAQRRPGRGREQRGRRRVGERRSESRGGNTSRDGVKTWAAKRRAGFVGKEA